ncbi:L,D-transpeptidase family protein [uncultured Cohaesibacter sp.]|uniref:L,D-transpeptidase family protein n=1 Tax=uncultured Cohaesibacter sp. TaxID=1002546 RepID=UPI0029C7BA81|nr:L,D-transpeptidase family protein [uncultured Cohaesibacter sp.]
MRFLSSLIVFLCCSVALGLGLVVFLNASTQVDAAPSLKPHQARADAIVIEKAARSLTLLRNGKEISRYRVRLGFSPSGAKTEEGDGKTPVGEYRIDRRNDRSRFHLSLGINYPLPAQRAAAQQRGVSPGGDIFIHGQPNRIRGLGLSIPFDWTDGCIAVSNREIEEIFSLVAIGTKVTILP